MVRLPRFAGIRTVSGGSRGVFPSSVFTRIPKPASVFALSPWVSQNVRTIATQRKRGVWRTYLQPIMMLGGFILVSSVVLAIGGVLLLLVVTVGGGVTLYYLGKAAYYDNFGKRGGLSAAAHIKPPKPGIAAIITGFAPLLGMLGKSIASWFSFETSVANTLQSVLHRRLQYSPIVRSYIPEPYKVLHVISSQERLANDRFTMEAVFPLVPQRKSPRTASRDSDPDSDDDTADPHLMFVNSTADLTPENIQKMIDYDSDDEHPENVQFSITEAKLRRNDGRLIDVTEEFAREVATGWVDRQTSSVHPSSKRVIEAEFKDKA